MSDRLRDGFEDLIENMEAPPSWEEITAHRLRPTATRPPGRRWMALVGGVVAVAAIGLLAGLIGGEEARVAPTIPYVRIQWTQQVEMRCQGMEIEDNGGFDSATIEIWGPTSDNLYRLDATAPDGTLERQILELGPNNRPIRAWYSLPRIAGQEEAVFRVSACSEDAARSHSSYSMADPPLFPMTFLHEEFVRLPVARTAEGDSPSELDEFLTDRFDERRRDDWRGQTVTVYSRQRSGVNELGSFTETEELWVDLDERRAERHLSEGDSEVLGSLSLTREVIHRAAATTPEVSFDPSSLHLIFDRAEVDDEAREPVVTTSIPPMAQPLMDDAVEIEIPGIPTQQLREAISPQEGDQLFAVPVGEFQVLVRLRAGSRPHLYATACDVLALVDLPQGWDGTCLERTVNGERETGRFPYGITSE